MDRRAFLALSAFAAVGGCAPTYLARYAALQGPDIEDWHDLPTRPVPTGSHARALESGNEQTWIEATQTMARADDLGGATTFGDFLEANSSTAFLALHNGAIAYEAYFNGYNAERLCKSFSMSKSLLSALFGIAQGEGLIDASQHVGDHVSGFSDDRVPRLPLQSLLNCTAGFAYGRGNAPWREQPQMYYTTDVRRLVRRARLEDRTDAAFVEEDISPLLLGVALEAALKRQSPDTTLSQYASEKLWTPLGAEADALWVTDRRDDGFEKVESGFVARARDLARFGQLFLDGGAVEGRQVVPRAWVERCAEPPPSGSPSRFSDGYLHNFWWGAQRTGMRQHDYFANGHFGQRIYLCPDKRLVLVRLGAQTGGQNWTAILARLADAWPS
ncbi:MAG: beta-lactamase family protein [Hyphomonadaceae bacterium]|nr:beta-lactamase family protein [Hyphomonadaceae bacterium]